MTPLGNSRDELWDGFRNARSGVRRITAFDPAPFPVQIAGEIQGVDPYDFFRVKERPHVSRAAALAITATRQALEEAKLNTEILTVEERRRISVMLGSGGGGLEFTERQYEHWFRGEPKKASVYTIPTSTIGTLSSEISMAFRFHGASHVVSTGCTSSTDALFYACDAVIHGNADIAITGGVDAPLAPGILAGFCLMRILTESWNDRPAQGSRPFSKERAGHIPMSATKSMVGHPQGASGAAGISAVLFAMKKDIIPPTLNLDHPDPECDLDYVPRVPREARVRYALANCIGFGSKNSALVLGNA